MSNPFSKEQKKISLCMPCYGRAYEHFQQSIKTINGQEYKNYELIVVFDGKQKKAEKELLKVMKKYPKMDFKYDTIKHGGAPAARNHAFSLSDGDIVAFPDPDIFFYPETIRMWMDKFEANPKINRVWGLYDIVNENGETMFPIGQTPSNNKGEVWYPAFKYTNYCSGVFPMRREVFPGWDTDFKSLQDWDMNLAMLGPDFEGEDWMYVDHHFFSTPAPHDGGISSDSHKNWIERTDQVRKKHNLPKSDIVVTSHGAPEHGMHAADKLGADFLPMPSFKPHKYEMVYLLGFYMREDPSQPGLVTRSHMQVFDRNKGTNVVHWIGTDVWDLRWHCSFEKIKELKKWWKDNNVIQLCECKHIQDELKEVGIDAKIVPIPPQKLYTPLRLPKEFSVGVYLPGRDIYNEKLMMDVARSMPDVEFYFFGNEELRGQKGDNWEHLGYVDYDEIMPMLSCNLRITTHDGLPLTPLQFMTAGRNVVTNIPLKGAIEVEPTRESIVAGVRKAQKNPLKDSVAQYWNKELDFKKYAKRIRGLK